jgi:hypothetical protein
MHYRPVVPGSARSGRYSRRFNTRSKRKRLPWQHRPACQTPHRKAPQTGKRRKSHPGSPAAQAFKTDGSPACARQTRLLAHASFGIRHKSTRPATNRMDIASTPMDALPVSCVNTLTRNVPMTAAYFPKISKNP